MDERFLKITVDPTSMESEWVRVALAGQMTWPHNQIFTTEINRLTAVSGRKIEVDLTGLTYLDSAGLATFISVDKTVQESGERLRISHPRRIIRQVFISAHLDKVLDILPEDS